MKILFYLLILLILFLLILLLKDKNLLITIICSLIIVQIIIAPKICIDAAISGVFLFFYKVFPSLFSFLVVSNIILCYDGVYIYSKFFGTALCKPLRLPTNCSFVLIISVLCGYPLGAKYACDLLEKKLIDVKTCERLLNIASNGSPLFILGSVGISMLKSSYIGYILLLSNIISCIAMGLLLPNKINILNAPCTSLHTSSDKNIGNVLKSSVENSIKTCLSIGGFVTLFSVINGLIKNNFLFYNMVNTISCFLNLSKEVVEGLLLGVIEMTNGCSLISNCNISLELKIMLVSFLFTFSGLSIVSQVYSFTYKFNISIKKYLLGKVVQGVSCSCISLFLYKVFSNNFLIQTFNHNQIYTSSVLNVSLLVLLILILPFILFKIKNLFNIF